MAKERLDILVAKSNPGMSRERARAEIMAGSVFVNNQKETKAGSMFPDDAVIEIRTKSLKYVSRGGLKLEKALNEFEIDLCDKICLDVGSSTGGFTDCMLHSGAKKVYSVDVGNGQLDWNLRNDSRVKVMEKTNIRYVTPEMLIDVPQFAAVDVSFISLTLVLSPILALLDKDKDMVLLIKPQFEAGRDKVGKHGVVREKSVHIEVISKIINFSAGLNLNTAGLLFSPIKGPEGNIEYLIHLSGKSSPQPENIDELVKNVVFKAHDTLNKGII